MNASDRLARAFAAAEVDGFTHALDIDSDLQVGYFSDTPVVAASVFKLPVLVELFRQADRGELDLCEPVTVPASGRTAGLTGLAAMRDSITLSWRDLAFLMIVVSDNAASDQVTDIVGCDRVTKAMAELGLPGTVVETDCRGVFQTMIEDAAVASLDEVPAITQESRASMRALNAESTNRTTASEMTRLLQLIWTDQAASPLACEEMRRILSHQVVGPQRLASGFPEDGIWTAGKTGTLPGIRNEVGVVHYPDGRRFAVATFTSAHSLAIKNPAADAVIGTAARIAVEGLQIESNAPSEATTRRS